MMAGLAGISVVFVGITATLGGLLVGNYTEVGQVLRFLGWEIYSSFYVPNLTLALIVAASIAMVMLGRSRVAGEKQAV